MTRYYAMLELELEQPDDDPDALEAAVTILGRAIDGANEEGLTCRIDRIAQEV